MHAGSDRCRKRAVSLRYWPCCLSVERRRLGAACLSLFTAFSKHRLHCRQCTSALFCCSVLSLSNAVLSSIVKIALCLSAELTYIHLSSVWGASLKAKTRL